MAIALLLTPDPTEAFKKKKKKKYKKKVKLVKVKYYVPKKKKSYGHDSHGYGGFDGWAASNNIPQFVKFDALPPGLAALQY